MKKKIIAGAIAASALLMSVAPAFAKVERVPEIDESWSLNTPSSIDFTCGGGTYEHTLETISIDPDTGIFSGTGSYDANGSYTWDIDGTITGDGLTFALVYTGTGAGYTLNGDGAISPDGSINGTTDGNCQGFEMEEGTAFKAVTFEGNHGQYVKMSDDKKGAAKSRVGMPTQSKGHTK